MEVQDAEWKTEADRLLHLLRLQTASFKELL
jgi:hypothetical protein